LERRARQAAYPALHRHVWSIVEVTRWLAKFPKKAIDCVPVLLESTEILPELASIPSQSQGELDPCSARVFAVDDDMDNCECIAMALEKLQIRTAYETNSERALAELIQEPRDLIVLDVDMPGLDGIGLYQRLRSQTGDIPVIFLSGLTSTEVRLRELPPGNFAFVSKPYNLASLALTASTMLLRSRLSKLQYIQS
jgi:CheY-like chemotaxis protein